MKMEERNVTIPSNVLDSEQKKIIFDIALEEAKKLKISKFQTVFLANMVLGKHRHPSKKIDEIARRAMEKMPERYHKNIIQVAAKTAIDNLEEELSDSETINEEWLRGKIVSNTVNSLTKIVSQKVDK